jgi:hypothetical protein
VTLSEFEFEGSTERGRAPTTPCQVDGRYCIGEARDCGQHEAAHDDLWDTEVQTQRRRSSLHGHAGQDHHYQRGAGHDGIKAGSASRMNGLFELALLLDDGSA